MSWVEDKADVDAHLMKFIENRILLNGFSIPLSGSFPLTRAALQHHVTYSELHAIRGYGWSYDQHGDNKPYRDYYIWNSLKNSYEEGSKHSRQLLGDLRINYWLAVMTQRAIDVYSTTFARKYKKKYDEPEEPQHVCITINDLKDDPWTKFVEGAKTEKETLLCLSSQVSLELL